MGCSGTAVWSHGRPGITSLVDESRFSIASKNHVVRCGHALYGSADMDHLEHLLSRMGTSPGNLQVSESSHRSLENPYTTPVNFSKDAPTDLGPGDHRQQIGEEFVLWERLRWIYNAILAIVSLLCILAHPGWISRPGLLMSNLVGGCIAANGCFTVGTLVSCYLAWLGFRNRIVSMALFVLGTLFSMFLTIMVLVNFEF